MASSGSSTLYGDRPRSRFDRRGIGAHVVDDAQPDARCVLQLAVQLRSGHQVLQAIPV
jgi:hypothetical protein